jgi:uncharacterized membrane protein YhaH (DUF805 family)
MRDLLQPQPPQPPHPYPPPPQPHPHPPRPPQNPPPGERTLWQWFIYGFAKRYADGAGRAHRKEFWGFMTGASALIVAGAAVDIVTFGEYAVAMGTAPFTVLTLLVVLAPSIAVTSRRFHDLGYSGWLALTTVVPVIAILAGLPRGVVGDNAYGPDPLAVVPA